MKTNLLWQIVVNLIVFALGLVIFIPSFYKLSVFSFHHFRSAAISGEVIDQGMGRTFGCRPLIQYTDSDGAIQEFKTRIIYHFLVCPEKGERVKILYRKGMPDKTIVASYFHHIFLSSVFIMIGLYLMYCGGRGKLK